MTQELEQFIDQGIRLGAELGYYPTVFMQMRERWGTVGAMKRLVVSGDIQSGFRRLHTLGLRDWSIEAGVIKFTNLFTVGEQQAAVFRLEQAGQEAVHAPRT